MADRVRYGIHRQLEDRATAMILAALEASPNVREEKTFVMTPWKEKHRKIHEIQSRSGAPIDPAVRRGIFGRAYNRVQTHLNSYDGPTRPIKMSAEWDPEDEDHGYGGGMLSNQMQAVMGVERADD